MYKNRDFRALQHVKNVVGGFNTYVTHDPDVMDALPDGRVLLTGRSDGAVATDRYHQYAFVKAKS